MTQITDRVDRGDATRCARCGAAFHCNPGGDCWCAELPALPMPDEGERCLCPRCLSAEIQQRAAERLSD